MLYLLSALLFSISANLDNIVIGIAYGIKNIRIGATANFIISTVTTLSTLISLLAGKVIASFLPAGVASLLGCGCIAALGCYFFFQSLHNLLRENRNIKCMALRDTENMIDYAKHSDRDFSGDIETKEALTVGLGLTLNNVGTGIAASASGVGIPETVVLTFIISSLFLTVGVYVGNRVLGKILGKFAPLLSGVLLIALSIVEYFCG